MRTVLWSIGKSKSLKPHFRLTNVPNFQRWQSLDILLLWLWFRLYLWYYKKGLHPAGVKLRTHWLQTKYIYDLRQPQTMTLHSSFVWYYTVWVSLSSSGLGWCQLYTVWLYTTTVDFLVRSTPITFSVIAFLAFSTLTFWCLLPWQLLCPSKWWCAGECPEQHQKFTWWTTIENGSSLDDKYYADRRVHCSLHAHLPVNTNILHIIWNVSLNFAYDQTVIGKQFMTGN